MKELGIGHWALGIGHGHWQEDKENWRQGERFIASYPQVPLSPLPPAPLLLLLLHTISIYRLATRINKNKPIPKKAKLGNQAPIKGERTPACAIAPLIKKIK
jgi:hypothetical protein